MLDVDYRGRHGRDWRTAVYRRMGGKDLDDIDAARYAVSQYGTDPKDRPVRRQLRRIRTRWPCSPRRHIAMSAALRPVTDWDLQHGYTSDILNTPQADAEAYRKSSPIFLANGENSDLLRHGEPTWGFGYRAADPAAD